jgi:peptidyl-tRNA hydrolase, PTH1 family
VKTPIQLIVGLGNPGPDYARTRHNAGQDFLEAFAEKQNLRWQAAPKFFGQIATFQRDQQWIRLLIPTTYMNRSGQAVAAILHFYKIPSAAMLVVHDELDLAPGIARLKWAGGHGGHNGLRDIISACSPDFSRLRLGIGHPGDARQVADFVLKKAPQAEAQLTEQAQVRAQSVMPALFDGDWDKAQRELHGPT